MVVDLTLDILKDLLSCYREGYAINSCLKIKVPKLEFLLDFFNSGNPFPNRFDGTFTTNIDNGLKLIAFTFIVDNKVAV